MSRFLRRSILVQLVSVYLLFVTVVLIAGVGVNAVVEQRLRHDVEASDQALAQEIALDTNAKLQGAKVAIEKLGALAAEAHTNDEIAHVFQAFMAAQNDIEHVYWLDPFGGIVVSVKASPNQPNGIGVRDDIGVPVELSPPNVVQQALHNAEQAPINPEPVFEVGIAQETAGAAGVIIANPVMNSGHALIGVVAMSLSLEELSVPLAAVVKEQELQGRHITISIIDGDGVLVATSERDQQDRILQSHLLQTVIHELPGADQALDGRPNFQFGPGPYGQEYLFSSVPIKDARWAVVVQRPSSSTSPQARPRLSHRRPPASRPQPTSKARNSASPSSAPARVG
ncbi:MAG: cache domain-containing protein [Ktedonobacterales bacterium]